MSPAATLRADIVLSQTRSPCTPRARLRELGAPIYSRKGELWTRLSDAERRISGLPQTQSYEELPTDFKFDIDDHIRFSQRNDLPDRKKNRGMHNERLSCNGWGPLLETKNGPIPRTESQKLGWHGLRGDDGVSKPLVPARHAMKRLGQRSRLSSCDETKYVADFYQSFGVSLFNPGAKPSAD